MLPEAGLSVVAPRGQTFAFAVSPYSPTEQLLTPHPEWLPGPSKTELGVYARVRGLGSANCGPEPLRQDCLAAGEICEMSFDLN